MKTDKMLIKDFLNILLRYKLAISLIFVLTIGFSIQLTNFLDKKYKSSFEINVYSKYFKNPLISEIIPGVYNIPEMRFTIDSMVKEALDDEFIDQIAIDYNIYNTDTDEITLARNRQFLRDRFKQYSTGGQSYQVTFIHPDPYIAKKIAEKTLDKVKAQFINSRIQTIEMVKEMMLRRLQALNASQKITIKGAEKALASRSPEVLTAELKKIKADIAALSKQYNPNHPKIQSLEDRKRTVNNWLAEYEALNIESLDAVAITMPTDKTVNGQITGKFYAKYHDFNMALDIEKKSLESYIGIIQRPQLPTAPIWPKKRLFASVGFILALIFGFIYIFIKEIMIPSRDELLKQEAIKLKTHYLGQYSLNTENLNPSDKSITEEKTLRQ